MGFALSNVKERKVSFYIRTINGAYVPVSFDKIKTDDWDNSFVVVRVENERRDVTEEDIDEIFEALQDSEVLDALKNTSFFITSDSMDFKNVGKTAQIKERLLNGEELADILEDAREEIKKEHIAWGK